MADLVSPMEVFAAMNASLLEKQPKPFNPIYTIRPTPIKPLKIGGKPPREVFYRDTLTFMTSLPPAVQPKLCSCKYLCSGSPASIICHSCSIYDPTKSAYFCDKCFPSRHPWYRVPHLYTSIENDESIAHTLKIAHRIAEATRYDNEGASILRKIRNQKPNLAIVADDEKVDNQLRVYGRKVVALEERVLEMRERLQRDIMFGDVVPVRRSLYSNDENDDVEDVTARERPHVLSIDDDEDPTIFGEKVIVSDTSERGVPRLKDLRGSSMFMSEPLFTTLEEDEDIPETSDILLSQEGVTRTRRTSKPQVFVRAPFVRVDTAESTDSMTISPFSENGGFFRDDSYLNLSKSVAQQPLQSIVESENLFTEGSSKLGSPAGIRSPNAQQNQNSPCSSTPINLISDGELKLEVPERVEIKSQDAPRITHGIHHVQEVQEVQDAALPLFEANEEASVKTSFSVKRATSGLSVISGLSGVSETSEVSGMVSVSVHGSEANNVSEDKNMFNALDMHNQQQPTSTCTSDLIDTDNTSVSQKVHASVSGKIGSEVHKPGSASNGEISERGDPADHPLDRHIQIESRGNGFDRNIENSSNSNKFSLPRGTSWLGSVVSVETDGTASSMASAAETDLSSMTRSSVSIQRIFKGYLTRRIVSKMLSARLMRVFSLEANRDYYYDRTTGASTWLPPKLLHSDHLEELEYVSEKIEPKLWVCKRRCPRHRLGPVVKRKAAIKVLQGFARCILSRQRVLAQADYLFRRVLDAESGIYYYANVYNGLTSWTKSTVYLHASSEPPILLGEEAETASSTADLSADYDTVDSAVGVELRRSPRYNRII